MAKGRQPRKHNYLKVKQLRVTPKKPSKQRKNRYQAPTHKLRKFLTAPLSEELRKNQGRRSYPVRKGDTVKILRGDFAGIEGKITDIETLAANIRGGRPKGEDLWDIRQCLG